MFVCKIFLKNISNISKIFQLVAAGAGGCADQEPAGLSAELGLTDGGEQGIFSGEEEKPEDGEEKENDEDEEDEATEDSSRAVTTETPEARDRSDDMEPGEEQAQTELGDWKCR